MRALFLSAQMPGHLDWGGYLQTGALLAQRGHNTLWASGTEVGQTVTSAGVPFHTLAVTGWRWPPPPPLAPNAESEADKLRLLKQRRALDQWLDIERVAAATEEIASLASGFRPDLIVSEMFVAAAGFVAEIQSVPFVVAGWPAPNAAIGENRPTGEASVDNRSRAQSDPMVTLARDRLQQLLARFGLSGRNWTRDGPPALLSPYLHLSYWNRAWHGGQAQPPTRHVGGVAPQPPPAAPKDLPPPDESPWVLITLGTSFNRDPNFFVNAAHAASRMGCLPLVLFGGDLSQVWVESASARLPESAVVRAQVNFASVLPYTRAAIHHGGAGTTHALVVHGIPQIVIPHAADQGRQAQGVARTGVGMGIAPKDASIDTLVAALSAVLPDLSPYRARALELQNEFRSLGGIPAAADLLERICTSAVHSQEFPHESPN